MPRDKKHIAPIDLKGTKDSAVLLIHGFTAAPDCMESLAHPLHQNGFSVFAPLLPGHGGTKHDLEQTTWEDWLNACKDAFKTLKENHSHVCVVGQSLGGLLALKMAEDDAENIAALACIATPVFLERWIQIAIPIVRYSPLRFFYRFQKKGGLDIKDKAATKNYTHTEHMPLSCIHSLIKLQGLVHKDLAKISCPCFLAHARKDSTAPYESLKIIKDNIGSKTIESLTLENSYHLLTLDYDKDLLASSLKDFLAKHAL